MSEPPDFSESTLHVVTGKGGTGKTTVACALGLTLARKGKRALVVEVEGRQGISHLFDVAPLGTDEVRLVTDRSGGEVWGLAVDPKAALLEYLQMFYRLGRAGGALERLGAIDFAVTIAPGVRDVLLIGKVYEAVGRSARDQSSDGSRRGVDRGSTSGGRRRGHSYDAVVLDAPPTGRSMRFLNVGAEVADVAKVGPIKNQADAITTMLRSLSTRVHLVSLLEAMPVQETLDGLADLEAIGLNPGAIFVNHVRESHLTDSQIDALGVEGAAELTDLTTKVEAGLRSTGLKQPAATARALIAQGQAWASRAVLQEQMRAELKGAGLPLVELGSLPDGVGDGGLDQIADDIDTQGVW